MDIRLRRLQLFWWSIAVRRSWDVWSGIPVHLQVFWQMSAIVVMYWQERPLHRTFWRINQRKTTMIGHSTGRRITMKLLFPEKFLMQPIICGHPAIIQRKTDPCPCWAWLKMGFCEDMCLLIRIGQVFRQKNTGKPLKAWWKNRMSLLLRMWKSVLIWRAMK